LRACFPALVATAVDERLTEDLLFAAADIGMPLVPSLTTGLSHSDRRVRLYSCLALAAAAMGDAPPATAAIDHFVRAQSHETLAADALAGLAAFPRWLWRNAEMLDFLGWLRNFNDQFSGDEHKVGVVATDGVLELAAKTVVWTHSRDAGDARAAEREMRSHLEWLRPHYERTWRYAVRAAEQA